MKIQFFIGIDISSDVLDFCLLNNGVVVLEIQIKNNPRALKRMIKELRKLGVNNKNSWFCAEHTGVYGNNLRLTLEAEDLYYSMVSATEISRSIGLVRGKSDRVDAMRIAEYCMRFSDKLKPSKLPSEYLVELKQLFSFRKQLVKSRSGIKNYVKAMEKSLDSASQKQIIKQAKKQIRDTDKLIIGIELQMRQIINEKKETSQNYKLLISVPGIGLMTASYMIICTENFQLFENVRKFASYAGVAPFEHQSGSSIRGTTKTSKYRNKQMKTLLNNGMSAVINGNNELANYYKRRIEEGKHKNKVKNAVVFKMISRAFSVIKRQTPYVQIDRYKFAV